MSKPPEAPLVDDIHVSPSMSVAELVAAFDRMGGFTSRRVARAAQILRAMRRAKATVLLSFPAALMATGLRGVLTDLVRTKMVDAVITTCGTLDHDLARLWGNYRHGSFSQDDAAAWKAGTHRLGNVQVPMDSYGPLIEKRLAPILAPMFAQEARPSTRQFCRNLGNALADEPGREASLLWQAAQADVPFFVPGPTDGAVGTQVFMAYQRDRNIGFDLMADEQELSSIAMDAKRLGALVLGGGITKHHLLWWAQFRGGLDYAVGVTTAVEYDGSLSGARLSEAISWGKLKTEAPHVTVPGDATLILPLLAAAWTAEG